MKPEDLLGHLGYLFLFIGQALLVHQKRSGWVFRVLGELIWIGIGIYAHWTSIWFWGSLFLIIESVGWWRWYEESKL